MRQDALSSAGVSGGLSKGGMLMVGWEVDQKSGAQVRSISGPFSVLSVVKSFAPGSLAPGGSKVS